MFRPDDVRELQTDLTLLGMSPGPVDGKMGAKTLNASRKLARQEALKLAEQAPADPAPSGVPELPWSLEEVVHGFDTSGHQKSYLLDLPRSLHFSQVFHIVKVTEDDSYTFSGARRRMEESRALGLLVGEYHFFRPENGWRDDLAHWKKQSCWQPGDLPPMNDAEKGRRRVIEGRPRPADRTMANHNFTGLLEVGKGMADQTGTKPLCYFTKPAWDWYFRPASDALKAQLGEVYDLVLADYVRDHKGRIVGDMGLLTDFDHSDLRRMRQTGLTGRVVIHQWTGRGRVPWYADSERDLDRCVMHEAYLHEVAG